MIVENKIAAKALADIGGVNSIIYAEHSVKDLPFLKSEYVDAYKNLSRTELTLQEAPEYFLLGPGSQKVTTVADPQSKNLLKEGEECQE